MTRFGSRQKGKGGEREVARLMERWWGEEEPGCKFASTPLSGGWNNATMRGGMKLSGDLCTTAERFPFVIEVKRREKFVIGRVITGLKSPVWKWWEQCKKSAAEMGGTPLLVFRKNRDIWYYIMPRDAAVPVDIFDPATFHDAQSVIRTPDGEEVYFGELEYLLTLRHKQFIK